jgi:hypothetical protein
MAELDVSGSFLITIGRGSGPETWVEVAANNEDGTPVQLPSKADDQSISIFVVLSAMFGAFEIPLKVVEVQPQPLGFAGYRVEAPSDLGVTLDSIRPATMGIVLDTGSDRGQGLACSCAGAEVTSWFADRTKEPNG